MSRRKIGRNEPCPCDSGKKYKKCCWNKNFDWEEMDDGKIVKSVPLSPEAVAALELQRERFIERFGREPGPDDPVFFDMPHTEHLEADMVEIMKQAGVRPEMIYAFEKTGRMLTEASYDNLTDAEQQEWEDAIDDYFEKYGGGEDEE